MTNRFCRYLILISFFTFTVSFAGAPLWTFTPQSATTISISNGQTKTIRYTVTNQSHKSYTLAMQAIANILQDTSGGNCPNPFTLGYQQSCTLTLSVNGSNLPGNVTGGPAVCAQGSSLACYQPSITNQVNITKTDGATISLSGSPLSLSTNGSAGIMTITNVSSSLAALDIDADLFGTALDGKVSISNNTCIGTLAPSSSCTITFIPGSNPVTETEFPIAGSNTNTVMGAISISTPIHIIFVTNTAYTGNLGGFDGANDKCNSDSAKPSSGFAAGYTYKALLNGNNATTSGVTYYRPDGTTPIATATGGNLVGTSSLTSAIANISANAWTGNNTFSCLSWTNALSTNAGHDGRINSTTSQYWDFSNIACNAQLQLYCVSQ